MTKKLSNELDATIADGSAADLGAFEICRKEITSLATQSNETLEASQAEIVQSLQVLAYP